MCIPLFPSNRLLKSWQPLLFSWYIDKYSQGNPNLYSIKVPFCIIFAGAMKEIIISINTLSLNSKV
ncbi:hypothetical protein H04402_00906 [Clostridium botulinum H04402 065]|nr:hypothetical protein H04402_00906 [Clostridium botulinum H04402 065]